MSGIPSAPPLPGDASQTLNDRTAITNEVTKKQGRAVFLEHYLKAKKADENTDDCQDKVFICLFIEIISSLVCYQMEGEQRWLPIAVSTLAIVTALFYDSHHPRRAVYFALSMLNVPWALGAGPFNPAVGLSHSTWSYLSLPAFQFVLLLAKITLLFLCTCWIRLDLVQRARTATEFMARACGLHNHDFASSENPPAVVAEDEEVEEGESRFVDFTKTVNEELGFVVSRSSWRRQNTDNEYLLVLFVMPRGLAERQGGIRAGDEILIINETNMDGASIDFAHSFIKQIDGPFNMVVRQNVNLVPTGNYYIF